MTTWLTPRHEQPIVGKRTKAPSPVQRLFYIGVTVLLVTYVLAAAGVYAGYRW